MSDPGLSFGSACDTFDNGNSTAFYFQRLEINRFGEDISTQGVQDVSGGDVARVAAAAYQDLALTTGERLHHDGRLIPALRQRLPATRRKCEQHGTAAIHELRVRRLAFLI